MTAVEIARVRIELGRAMRNKEDALAHRLLASHEAANRQRERETFARRMAQSEFSEARRKRA